MCQKYKQDNCSLFREYKQTGIHISNSLMKGIVESQRMTTLRHEIIESLRQQIFVLTPIQEIEYCTRYIHNPTNAPNTKDSICEVTRT